MKLAFILTTVAGMSTLLGTFLIFFKFKNINKFISYSLYFAAVVMFLVTILDLLPESINLIREYISNPIYIIIITLIFMFIGIIFSMIIDYLIPKKSNNLYKVGIVSMLAIILHNIPEGIATFLATNVDTKLGISMSLAIMLHNIPEGITISIPIYYSTKSKKKAFLYTLISALSEPFGAFITYLFLINFINNLMLSFILAIIAGIMLQIVLYELLPTAKEFKHNFY